MEYHHGFRYRRVSFESVFLFFCGLWLDVLYKTYFVVVFSKTMYFDYSFANHLQVHVHFIRLYLEISFDGIFRVTGLISTGR